ncbi:MAG: hypothetical protein KAS49_01855 [Candidatus Cloacimonetes bacterium]|nr:hypothetical protein [Candidatus Cloacimonadota bacterium]
MKKISTILMILVLVALVGCSANTHVIGKGAQTGEVINGRQWYVLYGALPLNEVDTAEMAGDATDYEITTEYSVIDVITTLFLNSVTVSSRTVTVKK